MYMHVCVCQSVCMQMSIHMPMCTLVCLHNSFKPYRNHTFSANVICNTYMYILYATLKTSMVIIFFFICDVCDLEVIGVNWVCLFM